MTLASPLLSLMPVLAKAGQPDCIYAALDTATRDLVGHKLFTLLYVDGDEVARVYSNQPAAYPVFGRKPMGPTPWGAHVLKGCKPYLGKDMAAIRWAFFDHALIESLGCGSVINIPIVYNGEAIGTMNLLDRENHYTEADVEKVSPLAGLLIPAFLQARRNA